MPDSISSIGSVRRRRLHPALLQPITRKTRPRSVRLMRCTQLTRRTAASSGARRPGRGRRRSLWTAAPGEARAFHMTRRRRTSSQAERFLPSLRTARDRLRRAGFCAAAPACGGAKCVPRSIWPICARSLPRFAFPRRPRTFLPDVLAS